MLIRGRCWDEGIILNLAIQYTIDITCKKNPHFIFSYESIISRMYFLNV